MKNFLLLGFILLFSSFEIIHAQEQLSLERCILIAKQNNFDLKIAQNSVLIAKSNESQSKMNFYPNLNAGINYNLVNGNYFDQTNAAISNSIKSSSPNIQSQLVLFQGLQNHHLLQRNKILTDAAMLHVSSVQDQVEIIVVDLYLQVLIGMEDIKIVETRLSLLNEQLERSKKRADAGVDNMQQVYNINSQIANENLNLVRSENKLKQDRLNLIQALQLDPAQEYQIMPVNISDEEITTLSDNYETILNTAIDYSPDIKVAEKQWEAEEKNLKIAKSGNFPTLTLNAGISSSYSSNIQNDYFDQIENLRNEYVGLQLNIPIFNQHRVKNRIQVSEISKSNAELDLKKTKMRLTNQVQQAYLELSAARSAFLSSTENLKALEQAFRFAETSYNNGNSDFYSYLESMNNKNRAELDLEIAKYSYMLRKRILEIYTGNQQ